MCATTMKKKKNLLWVYNECRAKCEWKCTTMNSFLCNCRTCCNIFFPPGMLSGSKPTIIIMAATATTTAKKLFKSVLCMLCFEATGSIFGQFVSSATNKTWSLWSHSHLALIETIFRLKRTFKCTAKVILPMFAIVFFFFFFICTLTLEIHNWIWPTLKCTWLLSQKYHLLVCS